MARKSLQELTGIASTIAQSKPRAKPQPLGGSAPAIGALKGSLSAIREIEPEMIDNWGPSDRLDMFTTVNTDDELKVDGFDALKQSIEQDGQQVPVLLRNSSTKGRYEIIYGRRRLRACRELGIRVRANLQDMDDATALIAKGLENAARRNLSFYEKARFAQAISLAGHSKETVRQVLNVSASGLSHLTKVTDNVPQEVGDLIGPAPKSGRPRWTTLAQAFVTKRATTEASKRYLAEFDPKTFSSDDRLDALLKGLSRREPQVACLSESTPLDGITIKSSHESINVSVKRGGTNKDFADWFETNFETIIRKSYDEFTAVNSKK